MEYIIGMELNKILSKLARVNEKDHVFYKLANTNPYGLFQEVAVVQNESQTGHNNYIFHVYDRLPRESESKFLQHMLYDTNETLLFNLFKEHAPPVDSGWVKSQPAGWTFIHKSEISHRLFFNDKSFFI